MSGFFHILKDFDEGKRSRRRKLEHHNKRRRRGPNADQKVLDEKENNSIEIIHIEEVVQDDEQSKDGTSLVNVKMEVQVPKLHYVYPVLFEAGKSIEIFACGSNLFQPNFW
ncbi:hypothetical protein ZOSMA_217G00090 [Zostera marina]|uniref:SBP-type domain-containing protein n=1 Tax=Zostera marina TaxID=29655 RepID=A0A0K9PK32_ZOSMR|nr:hypothetical protein ZOSMA_217G00090 [Zostera marina]